MMDRLVKKDIANNENNKRLSTFFLVHENADGISYAVQRNDTYFSIPLFGISCQIFLFSALAKPCDRREGTYEAGQRPCAGGRGVVPAQTRPPHVDRRGRPTPCKAARIDAGDPRLGLHHRWQPSPQDGTWAGRDAGGAGPISAVRSSRKPGRPYDRPAAGPAGLKPGPAGRGL